MTPEQLSMVQQSYAALGAETTKMASDFYGRLFASDPSAKDLFTEGPDVMSVKFAAELEALVESISSFPEFAPRVRELGFSPRRLPGTAPALRCGPRGADRSARRAPRRTVERRDGGSVAPRLQPRGRDDDGRGRRRAQQVGA